MTRLKRKIEGARGDLPQPILKEEKEKILKENLELKRKLENKK